MSTADWDRTLAVNLSAPFHLIQAALPPLLAAHGAVVNVSSCGARVGQAYTAAYCATKAGLEHLTRSLAMEYMHQPIRFNAVAPGGMRTMLARSEEHTSELQSLMRISYAVFCLNKKKYKEHKET